METINRDQFKSELRELVARYITTSSTFDDYVLAAEELADAMDGLGIEVGKFSDDEINESLHAMTRTGSSRK
jgi:hypothetical protein